jgi:hypothetical protein
VGDQVVDNTIRVFSGRTFSPEDIKIIKWVRKTYPKLSRSETAGTVCEMLNWTTPAGNAKLPQCKAFLSKLEEEGIIELPPFDTKRQNKCRIRRKVFEFDTSEQKGEVGEYEPIKLVIAKPGEELGRWRAYVNQYHMLGDKQVFGSRLQYFVKSGDIELGCMQLSASAWALEVRDKWIGWTVDDKKARLNLILNNSRFLIFPWVHIHNLASKALSIAAKQIQTDWLQEYCYAPVLLETFVDSSFFKGTSYKAANWIYLGETKGRGRMDRYKEYALSRKAIFVYPLQKDFKACLKREKPYKLVNRDE